MTRISKDTFEAAVKPFTGESRYCSYGNSLCTRSLEVYILNGEGYLCYFYSNSSLSEQFEYEYFKTSDTEAEAEFQASSDYAEEYYANNHTVAGGF